VLRGRSVEQLDLKSTAGLARALDLVREADVLLEGLRPGVMERLGLGPADDLVALAQQLLEQNPITGPAIARATADQRDAALAATAETLAAHREGDRVVAGASVWIVTALHPA
jgi:crotonobetainyl-CoA:carnitine CoA-transferase CaiB-like acyl-CoA transferase